MKNYTAREFRESGLLWMVNEFVLWPLGIALNVTFDRGTGQYLESDPAHPQPVLGVVAVDPPETIVDGITSLDDEPGGQHPSRRFLVYARARVDAMDKAESKLAMKRLALVMGAAIEVAQPVKPLRDADTR